MNSLVRYRAGREDFGGDVRVRGDLIFVDLKDVNDNVILSNDGEGNIDELGKVNAKIPTGDASFDWTFGPRDLVSTSINGVNVWDFEDLFNWAVTDTAAALDCWLHTAIPQFFLSGNFLLESVTLTINSNNNDAWITSVQLASATEYQTNLTQIYLDTSTDLGYNSTGDEKHEYVINHTFQKNTKYRLRISAGVNAGWIRLFTIRIKGRIV